MKNRKIRKVYLVICAFVLFLFMVGSYTYAHDHSGLFLKVSEILKEQEETIQKKTSGEEEPIVKKEQKRSQSDDENASQSSSMLSEEHGNDIISPYPPYSEYENENSGSTDESVEQDLSETKGHWEYRDVMVCDAWDERVLVQDGYMEKVLVSEAWDEEVAYCAVFGSTMVEMEVCNTCGAQFQGGINDHLSQTGHSGWHNEFVAVDDPYCQSYDSYLIHHDAVYQEVWHDPEYQFIHHEAEYRTEQYWVND